MTTQTWDAPSSGRIELSTDARFGGRLSRLARTSAVALGLIWLLWRMGPGTIATGGASVIGAALLAGWLLMPVILLLGMRWPMVRRGLVVPSGLVGGALLAVSVDPALSLLAAAGWWLLTAGIWLGGLLGAWFWFGWLPRPVPAALRDPFGPWRWRLIGLHVGMVVGGMGIVGLSFVP